MDVFRKPNYVDYVLRIDFLNTSITGCDKLTKKIIHYYFRSQGYFIFVYYFFIV